jgi:hypothetical protein
MRAARGALASVGSRGGGFGTAPGRDSWSQKLDDGGILACRRVVAAQSDIAAAGRRANV